MEMKRNLNENSTRSTAGCLPVPLFNQKKRTRQPLTSNPLKNDPGISTASDSCDFPPLPTDWTWEMMTPELPPLTKVMNTGTSLFSSQIPHSVSPSLRSQDSMSETIQINTERNKSSWNYGEGNKKTSLKTWDRNDFRPLCKQTNLIGDDGISSSMSLGAPSQKQLRVSEPPNLSHQRETEVFRQTHSSKIPASSVRGLDKKSASQPVKANFQQNQLQKKRSDTNPKENTLKETSTYQLKFKEKENSLRIICAVIESMRYWCEHAKNTVLLFEILAVLDSAVTSGPYYSKTFLMRDGKNSLPCVFYEIDRELPRLIRGRVHRCVGSYDQKKNIFKCVSVRPASVSEQKSFQALVKISDTEMKCYTNVLNEI